jgi:hypothetical protein
MTYQARDEVKFSDGSTAQKVAPVTSAGAPVNPAREDGNLQKVAAAADYVVSAAYRVTITGTSALLKSLSGMPGGYAFPAGVVRLGLIREDGSTGQVHFKMGGTASASTPQWPSSGIASVPFVKADADLLQVISSSGTVYATLLVMTPRN